MNDDAPNVVSFQHLSDAIEFLAANLEKRLYEAIADQCTDSLGDSEPVAGLPSPRASRLRAIQFLGERHAERSLRLVYKGRKFPWIRREFKLGGHGKELGHIHVDFDRTAGGWSLKEIWICR